jgi:hypothetical protein
VAKLCPKILSYLSALLLGLALLPGWAVAQRTALSASEGLYPRVVRIAHDPTPSLNGTIVASVTSFPGGRGEQQIFSSSDNGVSFARVGTISDPDFANGLCCGTLYELPAQVGTLRAGTLLWSGSVGGDAAGRPMQVKIYRSTDRGATWSYLSNCATATVNRSAGGLWEPEFTIATNGSLVCFYSDETVPGFSQLIHQVTSTDGISWTAPVRTIASGVQADRPGMIVVRKLPSGRYFMTLELCGPAACTVFYKTSANGVDWGPSSNVGARVETADGKWFLHTPTNAWAAVPGTANGRIFVIGQILSSAGGVAAGNGQTMFYNDSADGSGPWRAMAAPVTIQSPPAASNFCQNYSSPLLPAADGRSVLELATDFDASVCKTYFATASAFASTGLTLGATAVTVAAGQTGTSTITFTPQGDYRGTVRLSVAIPGFNGTATFASDTVTSSDGAAKTVQLTIKPGATAAIAQPLTLAAIGRGGVMLLLAGSMRGLAAVALGAMLLLLASCGSGDSGTPQPQPSTPTAKTYTATITATDTVDSRITATTTATITVN